MGMFDEHWLDKGTINMRMALLVVLILSTVLMGCGRPKTVKIDIPKSAPVQETPETIATKLRTPLAPLLTVGPGAEIPQSVRQQVVQTMQSVCAMHRTTENGKQAIERVAAEVEMVVDKARDAKLWSLALAGAEVYEVLVPGNNKYGRLKQICNAYLMMPKVTIKGFFNVDLEKDEIYAFLNVSHANGTTKSVKARVGEEFEGFRFVRIIGEQQGIELEYLGLPGEFVRVMK